MLKATSRLKKRTHSSKLTLEKQVLEGLKIKNSSGILRGTPGLSLLLGATLLTGACSLDPTEGKLKSENLSELKRYSEDEFSPVTRKIYYGGAAIPGLNLPRDSDRGALFMKNGEITNDIKRAQSIARRLGLNPKIPDTVFIGDEASKKVIRFYREQFGRNSYDGKGAEVNFSVDIAKDFLVIDALNNNAAWLSTALGYFIFGGGGQFTKPFIKALDVVGHEFTHGVVETTSNLEYVGQSGALNEHFADVFGEMFESYTTGQSPGFLIAESVVINGAVPFRNMLNPELGLSKQPGKMSDIPEKFGETCTTPSNDNDNCGVHILSGIPNRFAAIIISQLGWLKTRDMFYQTMTEALVRNSKFSDYATAIRRYANQNYDTEDANAVDAALKAVEL